MLRAIFLIALGAGGYYAWTHYSKADVKKAAHKAERSAQAAWKAGSAEAKK